MKLSIVSIVGSVLLAGVAMTSGCGKKDESKAPAKVEQPAAQPEATATKPADPPVKVEAEPGPGVPSAEGKVAIDVGRKGYVPDRIEAAPGQDLTLVFTRTFETECGRYVKVADGEKVELPMNQPVELAVKVPEDGEVKFACGMDMMTGVVVAKAN